MPYTLQFPTGITPPTHIVPDGAIDTTYWNGNVGVQLVGRNAISYGSAVAQNTIQMMSNFAGTQQPSDANSLQGQLWFNTTLGTLNVRTSATGTGVWTPVVLNTGGAISINISGNAGTATALQTSRNFSITGTDGTAPAVAFNGTQNVALAFTLANSGVSAGSYTLASFTVDAKGRITAASSGSVGSVVTSFNTRTGAVTLTSLDVTNALGFTPGTGSGTVTSVAVSGGTTGLTTSGGPITTSGTITLAGVLGVANGGTGSTSQAGSANSILPPQAGQSGKFLTTDGANASWATVSGGGGGSVTSVSASGTQGVTASVTSATSTPAITIGLGAITPTSISTAGTAATGALSVTGAITASGNITAGVSDSRLKTNLRKITEAVSKVQQLTGYTFDWDQPACAAAGFEISTDREVGVIAQDVLAILPEAVAPAPGNANFITVRYEKLVALLIEAVKEQAEQIELIKKMIK